jgi:dolichyl-phosphate beta-glucosyltransferase
MPNVSIIIPAYRSSSALRNNLPYLMSFIKEKNLDAEVLIVDDGSADDGATEQVAKSNSCIYLSYPINLGKGGAVRYGMRKASGDVCIFTDADIPFETDAIDKILYYLNFKEYDLVLGDRGLKESHYFDKISNQRRFGSGFFTFIVGRFITTGISDTQCGLKGFRKQIAKDLFSVSRINGFSFDVEIVYISLKRNYDIKKIPVNLRSQEGNSVNVFKHGFKMVIDLLVIKLNHVKGYYKKHE